LKCLIVGASAGLGRSLAERLASQNNDLFLVASDEQDLTALAKDIALRFEVSVGTQALDLNKLDAAKIRREVIHFFGPPDVLLFVAGYGNQHDTGPLEGSELDRLIDVNFRSAVAAVNAFLPDMINGTIRTCVGVGSVAATRARRANMVYGAAKRGLEFYFEAVRHRLYGTQCRVQFYRVGFMRTSMMGDRKPIIPAVSPDAVARQIIDNFDRDLGTVYAPRWWAIIALVLRWLPWVIFRRLSI
jgi:short-subunit dehydrogenase